MAAQGVQKHMKASPLDRLQQEVAAFTSTPTGVGLDAPFWLRRMEMEVHRVQAAQTTLAKLAEHFFRIPPRPDLRRPAAPAARLGKAAVAAVRVSGAASA